MPIVMQAIAVKSTSVGAFIASKAYEELVKESLILKEVDNDGSKLYVIAPSRGGLDTAILDELPSKDFVYVSVNNWDGKLEIAGEWLDYPFDLSGFDRMVLMVKNLSSDVVDNFKIYYQRSEDADYDEDDTDAKRGVCCAELGLYTEKSTDSVFIAYFEPELNALLKWQHWLRDEIADLGDQYGDDFAHTVFGNINYKVLEEVFSELDLDEELISSCGCFTAEGYAAPNDFTEYAEG
jgi:hypothetical protein